MKEYEYRDNNGNPIDYYEVVNDATKMLKELEEKDKQIDQLTNNWNELEEWLKEGTQELPWINGDMYWREACENVLDKMKEIKEKNNVLR